MKRLVPAVTKTLCLLLLANCVWATPTRSAEFRRLPLAEYRDKMKAGWIGQMAGVAWGAPTEFKWKDAIIPADKLPAWKPAMINDSFTQDDLYVEMTFLRTLEQYSWDVSIRQAGIDFANSKYPLWCANRAGRTNLRKGIAPPDSSHPQFNKCPNDIDYQIEADFSGLIAPGLPQAAIDLGEKFGRLMNYGDGMYAGQFVGALYAAAFFEREPVRIVETALAAIPSDCQYAEMVRDLLAWHRADPVNWEKTWRLCQEKYRRHPAYQKASNGGIDCKINGAYVLMGLLYGGRDLDQTIIIATRCGQDSDCNPSSAAGVLFTTLGFAKLPERFTKELSMERIFSHTAYSFPGLLAVSEKLTRQAITRYGGRVEKDASGAEVFVVPIRAAKRSPMELSWGPGPVANSRFSPEEMARITEAPMPDHMPAALGKFAPGWTIRNCGDEMNPGLRAEWGGRKQVLVTHPLDKGTGCVLSKTVRIPTGKTTRLRIVVGHDPRGDFDLVVRANDRQLLRQPVDKATANPWLEREVDLSALAGDEAVKLELVNQPTGWSFEAAYWAEIAVQSQ